MSSDSEEGSQKVIDDALRELGIGKYQIISFVLLLLPIVTTIIDSYSYIFTARDIPYRCYIPECEIEKSVFEISWLQRVLPYEGNEPKKCERFTNINSTVKHLASSKYYNESCDTILLDNSTTTQCSEYVLGRGPNGDSIVKDLSVFCEAWKLSLVPSVHSAGMLLSFLYSGVLSDEYGRKKTIIILSVLGGFMGIMQSFSQNYWMFISMEFIKATLSAGVYGAAYVMAAESMVPELRIYGCAIIEIFCSLSIATVGLLAWVTSSWRWMIRIANIPHIFLILLYFVYPESSRWLYTKGKREECIIVLQKAAQLNGVILSNNVIKKIRSPKREEVDLDQEKSNNVQENENLINILKYPNLLLRLILIALCWFGSVLAYNGLSINSVNISANDGNPYLDFILVTLIELPSILVYILILRFIGRRIGLIMTLSSSGIFCLIYASIQIYNGSTVFYVYILSKFFVTIAFILLYIYTIEMFPTNLRNSSLNFCSVVSRIAGILSSQVLLLEEVYKPLPMIIYGTIMALVTFAALKLPT